MQRFRNLALYSDVDTRGKGPGLLGMPSYDVVVYGSIQPSEYDHHIVCSALLWTLEVLSFSLAARAFRGVCHLHFGFLRTDCLSERATGVTSVL